MLNFLIVTFKFVIITLKWQWARWQTYRIQTSLNTAKSSCIENLIKIFPSHFKHMFYHNTTSHNCVYNYLVFFFFYLCSKSCQSTADLSDNVINLGQTQDTNTYPEQRAIDTYEQKLIISTFKVFIWLKRTFNQYFPHACQVNAWLIDFFS